MKEKLNEATISTLCDKALKKPHIKGFTLHVHHEGEDVSVFKGDLQENKRFFAASVTKSFVTAIILQLMDEQRISYNTKLTKFLSKTVTDRLHTYKGQDYTHAITIKHLLSNTTGLPDYFHGQTMDDLLNNTDQVWGLDPVLDYARMQESHFKPGHLKKVKYSDTNFQLLGAIIEALTKESFTANVNKRIIEPLKLKNTYMYDGRQDKDLVDMRYKNYTLSLPKYMQSIGPEGGLVSNAKDLSIFTQAFFEGKLFHHNHLDDLYKWRLLFGPGLFFYGIGIAMQPVSLFAMKKGMIGHWGQSGAFAFYYPKKNVYLSGSINHVRGHNIAAKIMIKVLKSL